MPREKTELMSCKHQMEQRIHSLWEVGGPVGMHLSGQRDLCFLGRHGLVLAGSGNITLSLFTGTKEGYGPPASVPRWREHAATLPSIMDRSRNEENGGFRKCLSRLLFVLSLHALSRQNYLQAFGNKVASGDLCKLEHARFLCI